MDKRVQEQEQNQNGLKMAKKNHLRLIHIYKKYIMIRDILRLLAVLKNYITIKFNSDKKISRKDIKICLSKQESYTAHCPVRRRFKRPHVLAFYKNYQWDTDMANMTKYKKTK